jgi:hypothetical protein
MKIPASSILALLLSATLAAPAAAQSRWVVVNGQRMNDVQVAYLQQRACTWIPNGHYWVDTRTGAWGYAHNPRVQGYIGDACRNAPRHRSLSERGLLYSPGEILNGR